MNNRESIMNYLAKIYHKGIIEREGKELCKDFDEIMENMPSVLSMILKNDYLSPVEEDWWKYLYSKSKYYKLKNIAINAFFDCLYL